MKTTIDKAGRVVIPADIRRQARLTPNCEVEITSDTFGIHLKKPFQSPELVRVGKRLVVRPRERAGRRSVIDIAKVVEEERDRWPL